MKYLEISNQTKKKKERKETNKGSQKEPFPSNAQINLILRSNID